MNLWINSDQLHYFIFKSYKPLLGLALQVFMWMLLIASTWAKDYEHMAIAAWWIILLELVQVNDNLKSLKDNW